MQRRSAGYDDLSELLTLRAVGTGSWARFSWDFGDGTRLDDSPLSTVQHGFEAEGDLMVKVTATATDGATATAEWPVAITNALQPTSVPSASLTSR